MPFIVGIKGFGTEIAFLLPGATNEPVDKLAGVLLGGVLITVVLIDGILLVSILSTPADSPARCHSTIRMTCARLPATAVFSNMVW